MPTTPTTKRTTGSTAPATPTTKTGVSVEGKPPTPVLTVTDASIEQCGDVGGGQVAWTVSVTTSDGVQHLATGEQAAGTEDDGVSDDPGSYQVLVRVQATSGVDGSTCTITGTTVVPT